MSEILFLAHRIPFPPDRGDKIRSHHVLKALAKLAPVHVATFADDPQDRAHEPELAALAASHCLLARRKPLPLAALESLATGAPLSLAAFRSPALRTYVKGVLASRPISVIYVFSGQMAQYVPADFEGRVVADLVDVDSAKFEAYGARGTGLRAWMERREARLLKIEEARIAARAEATLLVSEAEAALLRGRLPNASRQIHAMGNGINAGLFDAATVGPDAVMQGEGGPRIIFTGQMDYAPNHDAAMRAIERVLPLIRTSCPEATLHIVGRNPGAALRARDGLHGVRVWGRVDDIRPFLAAADIALVPLEIARGVQNKVLEAMAMGLPVVLSPGAATGIEARDGCDFAVAQSDRDLADAVIALACDPDRARAMGAAAREWILGNASWDAALARLPQFLGLGRQDVSHAA